MDELEETVALAVLRTVLRNTAQNRFCVVFHYCKLNEIGAVEHNVGHLLIGIYPFFLCVKYVLPVGD